MSVCLWVYLGVIMGVSVGVQEVIGVILGGTLGHALCTCLLYTSPSPRDRQKSRMPSSA